MITSSDHLDAPPPVAAARWRQVLHTTWLHFALRRSGRFIVSVWVVVTASFAMIHLIPGDPIRAALGSTASPELVAARRTMMGLNDPLYTQYWHYLRGIVTGDLGTSIVSHLPVADVIGDRLPATLSLALLSVVAAAIIAIPLGLVMAVVTRGGRRRGTEMTFTATSIAVSAIPEFLLGVGLVFVFSVQLGWTPVAGQGGVASYVLPVLALAIGPAAALARILRVETLTILQADYIRTARAKRLPMLRIYLRHALPNSLTSTITLGGLLLAAMLAGTVLVENVFAWPGLGMTIVSSILAKDYQLIQGVVLVYGIGVLLMNLLVDIVLSILDPRSTIKDS